MLGTWGRRREGEPPIQPVITDPELAENFSEEFTALSLSPIVSRNDGAGFDWDIGNADDRGIVAEESNPFGGFSFVASRSLLDGDGDDWMAG